MGRVERGRLGRIRAYKSAALYGILQSVEPSIYTPGVDRQLRESRLASFLRAIGQAVGAAVGAQDALCSIGTAANCLRGVAAKVASAR
jgi:hypothetical protein